VRFWDSSALVALCARDGRDRAASALLRADGELVVWWASRVECVSAFARLRRAGALSQLHEAETLERLGVLSANWVEVQPSEAVRVSAERLLWRHALRSGDALQLAAALDWSEGAAGGRGFVTFDARLVHAARIEGFQVLPEGA
jgi:uncharacterized protein